MKSFLKLATMLLVVAAFFLGACAMSPPVTDEQYHTALNEAIEAEQTADQNLQEKRRLEAELARKEAELRSLKDYERQLGL